MARPEGFEPPTLCLEGRRSFQLSYGRVRHLDSKSFEPSAEIVLGALTFCTKGGRAPASCAVRRLDSDWVLVIGGTFLLSAHLVLDINRIVSEHAVTRAQRADREN